jgi:RimJ/RimL family protein N-acetyltransferase
MLTTPRLLLRRWIPSDRAPFAALNADIRVMKFLPACLSATESGALADRIENHFRDHGFGPFAAELRATCTFIGFIGLSIPQFTAKFTPCVEIGWRLSADHWNQGLATEGAQAVVRYAFETLKLEEIVSFAVPANVASTRVMEKIGMTRDPAGDFDHPALEADHPLRRHLLYRLARAQWFARNR